MSTSMITKRTLGLAFVAVVVGLGGARPAHAQDSCFQTCASYYAGLDSLADQVSSDESSYCDQIHDIFSDDWQSCQRSQIDRHDISKEDYDRDWADCTAGCANDGESFFAQVSKLADYEAQSGAVTLAGAAVPAGGCGECSGFTKVRYIGHSSSNYVRFNAVNIVTSGTYRLGIRFTVDGIREFFVSVNGGTAQVVAVKGNGWSTPS